MSPEQTRGQPLDKRTDVWAFVCVLCEMLTGRRAFAGEAVSDTLASVLARDPDWALLPPSVSPALDMPSANYLDRLGRPAVNDEAKGAVVG
jgi:serine/threonine-protein kinase